jgi:phosphoribosylaminoimidazolecarboxamide formyltransferase/IMP cyclohydrolase
MPTTSSIAYANQLHGKELSYNNINDANEALNIVREFEGPAVVAVKHMNPCGVGEGSTIEEAYDRAYAADPVSIFGGILAVNREVDEATARKMHELFLEIIIAPSFSKEALEVLTSKKNLRLLTMDLDTTPKFASKLTTVHGGLLRQDMVQLRRLMNMESQWSSLEFAILNINS